MRSLTLIALALLSVGAGGCGGSRVKNERVSSTAAVRTSTHTVTNTVPARSDNDGDGDGGEDDINWGKAASSADSLRVRALVERYYRLAAAGDGAGACALILSLYSEEIPEIYGAQPDEPALRGNSCAVVMSKLFKREHRRLIDDLATLKVTRVRVKGLRGLALLSFRHSRERDIPVHRAEDGSWRISWLLDTALG